MKNIINFFKKNWLYFIPLLLLGIFIISIWDRNYYIGGDLMFPLKPEDSILKSIYLWVEENGGGSFFGYTLLLWQGFFYILSLVGTPSFLSIKIFIVLLYSLGFIFAYLTFKNLFKNTAYGTAKFALLAALLFFLNPAAILVLIGAIPLYAFPIGFYFIIKFLDNPKPILVFLFAFFVNISFFTEGPQLKLAVTFVMAVIFLLFIYKALRQVSIKKIFWRMLSLVFLTICLNLFILLPFINEAFGSKGFYQQYSQAVSVYGGSGDVPWAALPYTMRFFNSALIDKVSSLGKFLVNPVFILWTFFLWIVLLTGILLINDKKEKRIIFWLFLPLLFFIFLAKGGNPPFGEIYRYLIFNLPIFKLFRTTSTVIIGGVSFFAFLLTIAIFNLSKKWKHLFYLILLINIIVFHPIYLGYKLNNYLGEDFVQKGVSIPIEYFKMGKTLDDLKDDSKILSLPQTDNYTSKTWYFGQSLLNWLTRKPFVFNLAKFRGKLENFSQDEACLFSSLYNLGYVVYEKDSTGKLLVGELPYPGETLVENNYFSLKKISNLCQAPHLYIPTKIIYYQGSLGNLFSSEIKENDNLMFYQEDNLNIASNQQILPESQQILIQSLPNNVSFDMHGRSYGRLFFGKESFVNELFYPYVRISPDSVFYRFVLLKEERQEQLASKDNKKLFDKKLFYGTKRISEIEKWGINNDWWKDNLRSFEQKMTTAINLAGSFGIKQDNLELVSEYLDRERDKIKKMSQTINSWDREKITAWTQTFDKLKQEAKNSYVWPQFSQMKYALNVPVPGKYKLSINSDDKTLFDGKKDVKIMINNNLVEKPNLPQLGEFSLENLQNSLELLIKDQPNMIDPKLWQVFNENYQIKLSLPQIQFERVTEGFDIPGDNVVIAQEINNWQAGELYLLKIKYQNLKPDSNLHLLIKEKKNQYDRLKETWMSGEFVTITEDFNIEGEYQILIRPDRDSLAGTLYLYSSEGSILLNEISLTKIYLPSVNLTMNLSFPTFTPPVISYQEINPVKYKITVKNAREPFFLVLSETFNKGWKVYVDGKQTEENNHFMVNGYANAWYLDKTKDQEFTIEYRPQRLFSLGLAISLMTFLLLGGYAFFKFLKKGK